MSERTVGGQSSHRAGALALLLLLGLTFFTGVGAAPASAQPGATTTTLPTDNRSLGDIIPTPNSGSEPEDPGDRGGWLQVTLFFAILATIIGIAVAVWWQSKRARQRREAAGTDPVALAKGRGEGVRKEG